MTLISRMGAVIVAAFATLAAISGPDAAGGGPQSSIARGGRLYDNWVAEIREPAPAVSHPACPGDRALSNDPKTNWRCKEYHGWGYRGRDGAYGTVRHFTAIKEIRDMAGADPATIIPILKDENHRYGGLMAEADLRGLANFVSGGQVDMDRYVDRTTRMAQGNGTLRQDY